MRIRSSQASSASACAGLSRRRWAMPRAISPTVTTLMNTEPGISALAHFTTLGSGFGFRSSETTLVPPEATSLFGDHVRQLFGEEELRVSNATYAARVWEDVVEIVGARLVEDPVTRAPEDADGCCNSLERGFDARERVWGEGAGPGVDLGFAERGAHEWGDVVVDGVIGEMSGVHVAEATQRIRTAGFGVIRHPRDEGLIGERAGARLVDERQH